ncbi:MAG: hypothetical protein OXI96_08950 [Acidimicrobiaceae bacterium]|nr:hypothetical protein [Acidimicrobiaceae bacterium]
MKREQKKYNKNIRRRLSMIVTAKSRCAVNTRGRGCLGYVSRFAACGYAVSPPPPAWLWSSPRPWETGPH